MAVWWIIQILWNIYLFIFGLDRGSVYYIIEGLIVIGVFLPPTIVFFQLISHHYDAAHRHRLHKTYMISTVYVGVPLTLAWHLYSPIRILTYWCGYNCYVGVYFQRLFIWDTTAVGLIIWDIIASIIVLCFRLMFGHFMKKFAEEARTASMVAGTYAVPTAQFAPAQPMMYTQPMFTAGQPAMFVQPMMQPGMQFMAVPQGQVMQAVGTNPQAFAQPGQVQPGFAMQHPMMMNAQLVQDVRASSVASNGSAQPSIIMQPGSFLQQPYA